jgi:general secretion pathway protein E
VFTDAINQLKLQLQLLTPKSDAYASQVVELLLRFAVECRASDLHIEKSNRGLNLRMRVAGSLVELGAIPDGQTTQVLARIKAMARLITYRSDLPQEGRFQFASDVSPQEARVGTLPLVSGERAVIRLAADENGHRLPNQLGLPAAVLDRFLAALQQASGVILITGSAGSGKTTSAYAGLRYLVENSRSSRSLVTLEDPVEVVLNGVSQSQMNAAAGYTWEDGLKAILRQDPEVLLVGEIRDDVTARLVFQAAMTGQLVISTMHARSAADSLRRLLDMQVPVHHLLSCLEFLACQKLGFLDQPEILQSKATPSDLPHLRWQRHMTCELLPPLELELAETLMSGGGGREIELAAKQRGMISFADQ